MSCSRTQHGDLSGARTPDLWESEVLTTRPQRPGFLPYIGVAAIMLINFHFMYMYLEANIQNLVEIGSMVTEKSKF